MLVHPDVLVSPSDSTWCMSIETQTQGQKIRRKTNSGANVYAPWLWWAEAEIQSQ